MGLKITKLHGWGGKIKLLEFNWKNEFGVADGSSNTKERATGVSRSYDRMDWDRTISGLILMRHEHEKSAHTRKFIRISRHLS